MRHNAEEPITADEAARLIFDTPQPSAIQVGQVVALLRSGAISPSGARGCTTTRVNVARYLGAREQRKQEAKRCANGAARDGHRGASGRETKPERHAGRIVGDRKLRPVYRELLNDYFLAILMRGRARGRSQRFQTVVLASRCLLLVALAGVMGASLLFRTSGAEGAVQAWLQEHRGGAELLEISPADVRPGINAVRVRYRYPDESQAMQTVERVFVISGGAVVQVLLPDAENDRMSK